MQELRAKRTLNRLALVGEVRPLARREGQELGQELEVHRFEVVFDDIPVLGTGDKMVMDGMVTKVEGLELDESLLTGEANPALKRPGGLVLSGSFAVAGNGSYRTAKVGEAYAA